MKNIIRENNIFTVIDLETSHFHPDKGAMIIEIAAVKIANNQIVDKRTQLINPERKVSQKITELTSITNEMLKDKEVYREVLPKFYEFIKGTVVVAHNSSFDWDRFLLHFFKKVGIFPDNQVVDTLKLSREFLDIPSYKLEEICKHLNIEHSNKHRALGDALATAEAFLYLKKNFIDNSFSGENLDLYTIKKKSTEIKNQNIRKTAYWEKSTKEKLYQRIYVTLDRSVVFYDIPTRSWEAKATKEPIDFEDVERKLLEKHKAGNIESLVSEIANIKLRKVKKHKEKGY